MTPLARLIAFMEEHLVTCGAPDNTRATFVRLAVELHDEAYKRGATEDRQAFDHLRRQILSQMMEKVPE